MVEVILAEHQFSGRAELEVTLRLTRREWIAALFACGLIQRASADEFVSIVAKDTTDPGKSCGITLYPATKTWTESEVGNAKHFYKTKKGKYQVAPAPNITELLDANGTIAGNLENLNPETAKKGDKGHGKGFETAVVYDWEVQ